MVKRYKFKKKDIVILIITAIYLAFNLVVSYIRLSSYLIIALIVIGAISSSLYSGEKLGFRKSLITFLIVLLLEIGIIFISALLFESNLIFIVRKNFFETGSRLVKFYCIMGVIVIQNTLNYIVCLKKDID